MKPAWHEEAPRRLDPQNPDRQPDEIYHFLLPDPGHGRLHRQGGQGAIPGRLRAAQDVAKDTSARRSRPHEIARLQQLSDGSTSSGPSTPQWLARDRKATEDQLAVWPHDRSVAAADPARNEGGHPQAGPAQRRRRPGHALSPAKLVMDYWCALWFWPIRQSGTLAQARAVVDGGRRHPRRQHRRRDASRS